MRCAAAAVALLAGALPAGVLSSCGATPSDAYVVENDPGHVEEIPGQDVGLVSLTGEAAQRLGIDTTPVARNGRHLVVPSEAVLVDAEGVWWVFTNPEPDHFVRAEIDVSHEKDGTAYLESGPAPGTQVVTVGVAELYGVEEQVGH